MSPQVPHPRDWHLWHRACLQPRGVRHPARLQDQLGLLEPARPAVHDHVPYVTWLFQSSVFSSGLSFLRKTALLSSSLPLKVSLLLLIAFSHSQYSFVFRQLFLIIQTLSWQRSWEGSYVSVWHWNTQLLQLMTAAFKKKSIIIISKKNALYDFVLQFGDRQHLH